MIDQGRLGQCKGGLFMRIRDLEWQGLPAWPPEWWISDEGAGEEGLLTKVQFRYDQTPVCIALVATHLGENRNGIIILADPTRLEILCNKLKENLGRSLLEIGDLEIDFLQSMPKEAPKQMMRHKLPFVLYTINN
jgi:hypothetical protein